MKFLWFYTSLNWVSAVTKIRMRLVYFLLTLIAFEFPLQMTNISQLDIIDSYLQHDYLHLSYLFRAFYDKRQFNCIKNYIILFVSMNSISWSKSHLHTIHTDKNIESQSWSPNFSWGMPSFWLVCNAHWSFSLEILSSHHLELIAFYSNSFSYLIILRSHHIHLSSAICLSWSSAICLHIILRL